MTNIPGFLRRFPRLRGEGGFTLIEAVFAMVLFAGLAAAMAGLLTSAISANKLSRQRTIAEQTAMEQIEQIRRLAYEDVGTVLGNPPGLVNPTASVNVTGLDATITVQIRYVDDPTPTSYETTANYKRVMVTVRRDGDNQLLAREVTYVAPTSRTPFGGVNLAIVQPLVIDYSTGQPLEGATVDLLTGPSAPRSDVTDANGKVSFQKLTPNPTASCPSDCYDLTAALSGYEQLDAPTRINVGPGQTATPTVEIFRPGGIDVVFETSGGTPYTGAVVLKATSGRTGATQTLNVTGGSTSIAAISGEKIIPLNVQYTLEAHTTGTPLCATPVTTYVGDAGNYPNDLTTSVTLTLGACPSGDVVVNVTWGGSPAQGVVVTLSGGPYSLNPVSGATDSAGQISFSNVPSGAGYTVTASKGGQSATPQTISVTTGATTTVNMTLPTGTLAVNVRWAGVNVNAATVTVSGGPNSISPPLTGTTNSSGNVTFINLPAGSGYTVTATKLGQSASASPTITAGSTTNLTLNLPTATLTVNVKRSGINQSNTTVRLQLGPMSINRTAATNTSGNATFTNVPVGSGYTIKAFKTDCSGSPLRSVTVTNQTKTSTAQTINVSFNVDTCPVS